MSKIQSSRLEFDQYKSKYDELCTQLDRCGYLCKTCKAKGKFTLLPRWMITSVGSEKCLNCSMNEWKDWIAWLFNFLFN